MLNRVNALYEELANLRKQNGKTIHVAIGSAPAFAHTAELELSSTDVENYHKIFPDGSDITDNANRHHPFFRMLKYATQSLIILPGEGYDIYQDEDTTEVAVIAHKGVELKTYTPTIAQIKAFAQIYNLTEDQVIQRLI